MTSPNKTTLQAILVMLILSITTTPLHALTGQGTQSNPYKIQSLTDFEEFAADPNYWTQGVHTRLETDINLASKTYTTAVIAPDMDNTNTDIFDGTPFSGTFDGNDHIVSNLTINAEGVDNDYLALFGQISDPNASIKKLNIEDCNITGGNSSYLGGLTGWNYQGTIINCYATGTVAGRRSSYYLGGLCGFNEGTIIDCKTNSSITAENFSRNLGGLCGFNYSLIINCSSAGSVTSDDYTNVLGGLCGWNGGTIKNCYATNMVVAKYDFGGLCGFNTGTISGSYASGSVKGEAEFGGLCGVNSGGTITNCYATGEVVAEDDSSVFGGLCGGNSGTITNCYAAGVVNLPQHFLFSADPFNGDVFTGGLCGYNEGTITNSYYYLFNGLDNNLGTPLGDLQMLDAASYVGFDFAPDSNDGLGDYWAIINGHCPKLSWQTDDGPLAPTLPVTTLSGRGNRLAPFQINSYDDFAEFRNNNSLLYGYYDLNIDVNFAGETFTTAIINRNFGGRFYANGHVISNITIDTAGQDNDYLGLFRKILTSVCDLGIENINITGSSTSEYLGGLCGSSYQGAITNCYATGTITGIENVGGLCGDNYQSIITNCHAIGSIVGECRTGGLCGDNQGVITNSYAKVAVSALQSASEMGGLCGSNFNGTITNCYATGSVTGGDSSWAFGGLCGENFKGVVSNSYAAGSVIVGDSSVFLGGLCGYSSGSTIANCYAAGSVTGGTGSHYVGGLCGGNNSLKSTIENCYSTGLVTSGADSQFIGGLCGSDQYDVNNSFWDTEISGMTDGVGGVGPDPNGVTGKTTEEMQTMETYTDAGWDFDWYDDGDPADWFIQVCEYPILTWQISPADLYTDGSNDAKDFAVFAEFWQRDDCSIYNDYCDYADLDFNGQVDMFDLVELANHWLSTGIYN
jgi:hypothetical protein